MRQRTVLIVEDSEELRALFRTALALEGYRVTEAFDGMDALRRIDVDPPDLVVLDLGLPVLSGEMVRRELSAQAHTRDIPVVVVTGSAPPLDLDVACVLMKPVSIDNLLRTIRTCLAAGEQSEKT